MTAQEAAEYLDRVKCGRTRSTRLAREALVATGDRDASPTDEEKAALLESIRIRCVCDGKCWLVKTTPQPDGRIILSIDNRSVHARKWVYETTTGKKLQQRFATSARCGNDRCVSPACVVAISRSRLMRERAARGMQQAARISAGRGSKVSLEAARDIRSSDEPGYVLAERYGITVGYANLIKRNKARKEYSNPFAGLMPPDPPRT
jgi:hypothetical protein